MTGPAPAWTPCSSTAFRRTILPAEYAPRNCCRPGRHPGWLRRIGWPGRRSTQPAACGGLSIGRRAQVVEAESWFFDAGYASAPRVVPHAAAGLFCANDQLAAAVIRWCRDQGRRQPPIVGFDDAPVAEQLNLTTIAIPWDELVEGVVRVLKRRVAGDRSTSSQQIFHPRPVIRGFGLTAASQSR